MDFITGDKIIFENKNYTIVGINEVLVSGKITKEYILVNWINGRHLKVREPKEFKHV